MSVTKGRKARNPVQARSQKTREKILNSGRKLFSIKGYHGTNSKEIARNAGVATGSFYAYFSDKGSVFLEITEIYYQQIFGRVNAAMETIEPSSDRSHIIAELVQTLFQAHDIEPELHREISLMILAGTNPTAPVSDDQRLYNKVNLCVENQDRMVQEWLRDLLIKWEIGSETNDLDVIANLIFRVTEETIHRLKQFPGSMAEPEQVLRELVKMIDGYLNGVQ